MFEYKIGIEFEYALTDLNGNILDFTNLDSKELIPLINESRAGQTDSKLSSGDLGIKDGFWYLEGDERFNDQGEFTDLKIKGIEIRTPICESINEVVDTLVTLEKELSNYLKLAGLNLAIIGFNPKTKKYIFEPNLNNWELNMRNKFKEYDHAEISNLTYGPDINISSSNWDEKTSIDIAEKLNYYSPYIVPFSFSAPFYNGKLWEGYSKRTYERTGNRPAVKAYTSNRTGHALSWKANSKSEVGRIEYKAFDAILSKDLLNALCSLVLGIALADLPGRSKLASKQLHEKAAKYAFTDAEIKKQSTILVKEAYKALKQNELRSEAKNIKLLQQMLELNIVGSDKLKAKYNQDGTLVKKGGLVKDNFILF